MGAVLQYKWEVVLLGFPFFKAQKPGKSSATNGGAYCRTNWRCTAILSSRPVGVGVSETLLRVGVSEALLKEVGVMLWLLAKKPVVGCRDQGSGKGEVKGKGWGAGAGTAKSTCKFLLQPPFNKLCPSECLN